jgi:hypothetical protein
VRRCPRCNTPYLGDYKVKGYGLTTIANLVDMPLRTAQDWQQKGVIKPTVTDPPVKPRALYTLGAAFKAKVLAELRRRPLPKPFPLRVVEHSALTEWLEVPRPVAHMEDKLILVAVPKELAPKSERRPKDLIFVGTESGLLEAMAETKSEAQGVAEDRFMVNLSDLAAEVVVAAEAYRESLGIDKLLWAPWL